MIQSYKRLPIGKYQELLKVFTDTTLTTVDRNIEILAILSGYDVEQIMDMPIMEVEIMMQQASFLDSPLPETKGYAVAKKYIIGDMTLIPVSDAKKMNVAQYVDFQTFSKDSGKYLIELLSCLLVPEGKKYNTGYDIVQVQQLIRDNLSIWDANEITAFFLRRSLSLTRAMLTYSIWTLKKMKPTMKTRRAIVTARQSLTLLKNGDGLTTYKLLPTLPA